MTQGMRLKEELRYLKRKEKKMLMFEKLIFIKCSSYLHLILIWAYTHTRPKSALQC